MNLDQGESYIDISIWIKNKRVTINPINNKYDKHFSICCNGCIKLWRNTKNITENTKNWEGINYPRENDYKKKNHNPMISMLRFIPTFQNIAQSVKNKLFL